MLCGSCIQPKKQFQVQTIGILEEIDQKCTYEKVPQNLGPPLIWTKSKITAVFPRESVPKLFLLQIQIGSTKCDFFPRSFDNE